MNSRDFYTINLVCTWFVVDDHGIIRCVPRLIYHNASEELFLWKWRLRDTKKGKMISATPTRPGAKHARGKNDVTGGGASEFFAECDEDEIELYPYHQKDGEPNRLLKVVKASECEFNIVYFPSKLHRRVPFSRYVRRMPPRVDPLMMQLQKAFHTVALEKLATFQAREEMRDDIKDMKLCISLLQNEIASINLRRSQLLTAYCRPESTGLLTPDGLPHTIRDKISREDMAYFYHPMAHTHMNEAHAS